MAGNDAFEVEGAVVLVLPKSLYRVELSNGHVLTAYVAGRGRQSAPVFAVGDRVKLELSPYDLSEGRIVLETNNV
jgi:translation initiation factor IF-1